MKAIVANEAMTRKQTRLTARMAPRWYVILTDDTMEGKPLVAANTMLLKSLNVSEHSHLPAQQLPSPYSRLLKPPVKFLRTSLRPAQVQA